MNDDECDAEDNTKRCKWATKCDYYSNRDNLPANCSLPNPCRGDNALCLTRCDNQFFKDVLKC